MSIFILKVYEFGVGDWYYRGEDERLWKWLLDAPLMRVRAWDTPPLVEDEPLRVVTPVGFTFYDDLLVPWDSDVAIHPPEPLLNDFAYVSSSQSDADKAFMLITNPYKYVSNITEDEFKALDIANDRVFEVTV